MISLGLDCCLTVVGKIIFSPAVIDNVQQVRIADHLNVDCGGHHGLKCSSLLYIILIRNPEAWKNERGIPWRADRNFPLSLLGQSLNGKCPDLILPLSSR